MIELLTIFGILILVAIAVAIVLLIAAVLLRAAVALYNRFVGGSESPRAVAVPSFQKAVGIVLVLGLVNAVISTGIQQIADLSGAEWLAGIELARDGSFFVEFYPLFLLEFVTGALLLTYLLPTRFARAVGVSVCHSAICIAVAAVAIGAGLAGAALVEQLLA
jgi:hypothetical protein